MGPSPVCVQPMVEGAQVRFHNFVHMLRGCPTGLLDPCRVTIAQKALALSWLPLQCAVCPNSWSLLTLNHLQHWNVLCAVENCWVGDVHGIENAQYLPEEPLLEGIDRVLSPDSGLRTGGWALYLYALNRQSVMSSQMLAFHNPHCRLLMLVPWKSFLIQKIMKHLKIILNHSCTLCSIWANCVGTLLMVLLRHRNVLKCEVNHGIWFISVRTNIASCSTTALNMDRVYSHLIVLLIVEHMGCSLN